ncbi:carbohydrate ABC transporter ATP-binding protein (CUT1 family) [Hungatella effluvii]|uniref:Carbohydrate ABC transporter ATP-binding protein (CUT1 family) n=1 Tax=Hungatella effluvii TaxID=1096246 RepID=A0A2V3YA42_9FIRM|nr:ABC transporter ATP-binding protein [Hungatella effluvii]PXX53622.1 carbohydrate ABC transporter ATP-binding protein (CUT1 family) [Hungatella effluvii]
MSYLEIKNLQKKYTKDGPLVVNNMNLSIEKGEFIVFLGPSGCGKTTTIRMISGLEDISGGEILIDGEDVIGKKPKDRGVSMIFQSYAIWPHMTVFDNIAYPLKLQKVPKDEIKKRVTAAAEATDIVGLLNRYPAQMSGGQRQRVAVSRAIVVKPKIFLMDEPLSNLDAKLRVSMRTELKNIHIQQNSTSIFVTHDQSEAMSLADRIVVMYKGRIEQIGTPMEVYQDSATRFVAEFIGTPPTNFFVTKIEKTADGLMAINDDIHYLVPDSLKEALLPYAGKEVDLGVRPEYIDLSFSMERTKGYLCDTVIDFVEPQGSHAILITKIGGNEVKIHTTTYMEMAPKTNVALNVKDDKVMFFDRDTSFRIK